MLDFGGSGPGQAKASAQSTVGAAQAAQRTLATLKPDSANQQFAINAQAALANELTWLKVAASVLDSSGSPMLFQIGSLGVETQTKLQAIDSQVSGASASFPGSTKLIAYAQHRAAAASTRAAAASTRAAAASTRAAAASAKSALIQFSGQVQALQNQSGPAYLQINQLFGQIADGCQRRHATRRRRQRLRRREHGLDGLPRHRRSLRHRLQRRRLRLVRDEAGCERRRPRLLDLPGRRRR
jgi:hypothetical protein